LLKDRLFYKKLIKIKKVEKEKESKGIIRIVYY